MPVKAAQFPKLSGEAEDVLVLKPDVVVAGRFTKRATRELLKEKGLRVVEFDAARSLDDVKKQIRQMGDLVQHPDRAAAEIKRLDAAIAHAREVVSRKPLSRAGAVAARLGFRRRQPDEFAAGDRRASAMPRPISATSSADLPRLKPSSA